MHNKLIAISLVVASVFCMGCGKGNKIDGLYKTEIGNEEGADSTIMKMEFDADKKTYTQSIESSGLSGETGKGTFEVDEEKNSITCKGEDGKETVFKIKDDMIYPVDFVYQGEVPDSKTFNATFTYADGSAGVMFKEDGTYIMLQNGEPVQSDKMMGTYEKSGNTIKRNTTTGAFVLDWIVVDGGIVNSYYTKE